VAEVTYEELAEQFPETVVLRLRGNFYNAFNECAFVLNVLLEYKVRRMGTGRCRVGFPANSLEKVLDTLKKNQINVIVFEGEKLVENITYETNQFNCILKQFSEGSIEESEKQIKNKKEAVVSRGEMEEQKECKESHPVGAKQRVSFVQGQGINLENAIMDVQRAVERLMETGKKIVSFSFIENRETERKDAVLVQGLVVYEILTEE